MNGILDSIGYGNFLLVIFILVLVHELGHYCVARWCGIGVEVFSIGFGKEIFGFNDKSGTRWRLSMLPLGGYVRMKGEMLVTEEVGSAGSAAEAKPKDKNSDAFHHKSLWRRVLVVAAGPFANYLYASVVLALMFIFSGQPQAADYHTAGIGQIADNSAAQAAGLRSGDVIVDINGRAINNFTDMAEIIGELGAADKLLRLQVLRDRKPFTLELRPQKITRQTSGGEQVFYRIGVGAPPPQYVKLGVGEAAWLGVKNSYDFIVLIVSSIADMFSGKTGTEDLGGIVRIAQISKDFGASGAYALLYLTVILSINLGLLNLLPIPMLDGGHLLLYGIEAVRGKPVSVRLQNILMRIGLIFLVTLVLWLIVNDIRHITF